MKKLNVAILGSTGIVGQNILTMLVDHPYFKLKKVFASTSNSLYKEKVKWSVENSFPSIYDNLYLNDLRDFNEFKDIDLIFSALPSCVATDIESKLRSLGKIVISNASSYRMEKQVPLLVPELGFDHINLATLVGEQRTNFNGGFIACNPNCSVIGLVLGIYPIYKSFGLNSLELVTMQAISGAGINGLSSMDILSNVIPYIDGEEEKIETEFGKIISDTSVDIKARVNRVAVKDGHNLTIFFKTKKSANIKDLYSTYKNFKALKTYTSKNKDEYKVYLEANMPQVIKHINYDEGYTTHIGRIKAYSDNEFSIHVLSNNIKRGAALGTLIISEALYEKGFVL